MRLIKIQLPAKHIVILLILCGSLLSCKQKTTDKSIVRSRKYKESVIEAYKKVSLFSKINNIPGLTVAVSINNQLVWADGFGYSNYELKAKASPTHKFRIGQASELITALTAAKLYEQGKLKLDQPVAELLPGLSQKPLNYTIYQLGVHSSGIREEKTIDGKGNPNNLDKLVASFINNDLQFAPGTYVSHSELGFDLIGYIIQKTNNELFTKVVKKTLLDTLKLSSTIPDNPISIIEDKSSTYNYDYIAQPIVSNQIDLRGKEASAGYLSSVLDLVKLGNTLLYPGFFKQQTIDLITKPYVVEGGQLSPFGFGLIINKDNKGQIFYGQRGSLSGGSTLLLIYPEDKLVIAMSSNIENGSGELPVFDVASIFQDQLHPDRKAKTQEKGQESPKSK